MSEILHANIFFVIASVATVIFCIITSLILWQVLKMVTSLRKIIDRIELASEQVADDVAAARAFVVKGGIFSKMIGMMMGAMAAGQRRRDDD